MKEGDSYWTIAGCRSPRAKAGRRQAQVCTTIYGKYCDNSINVLPYRYRYNMQMHSRIHTSISHIRRAEWIRERHVVL